VARWLEDGGVEGLWDRMQRLSQAYQEERPDLESADLQVFVIKVLFHYVTRATRATNKEGDTEYDCTTADMKAEVLAIASDEESGIHPETISTDRVGRVLGRMRFKKKPRPGGRGLRRWIIPLGDLQGWAKAYGIVLTDSQPPHNASGSSGTAEEVRR
jgi:hypothetical protein